MTSNEAALCAAARDDLHRMRSVEAKQNERNDRWVTVDLRNNISVSVGDKEDGHYWLVREPQALRAHVTVRVPPFVAYAILRIEQWWRR
jgi:hypothetical protein